MNTGKTAQGGYNREDHQCLTGRLRGKKKKSTCMFIVVLFTIPKGSQNAHQQMNG